jgi:hypothetical protein
MLIDAILAPGGLSRVVLTSRILPESLSAVDIIPIHDLPPEKRTPGYAVFRSACSGVM